MSRVTIIGGGNIGTHFACVFANKGHDVSVYTSKPELFDGTIEMVDENGTVTTGTIRCATSDIGRALEGAEYVFITYPAAKLGELADKMYPFITEDMSVGVIPGTGGAEYSFHRIIRKGTTFFGIQRVPAVARLESYGRRVRVEGKRPCLMAAAIPGERAEDIAVFLRRSFDMGCEVLPNYLNVTLTPSNPILHTSRLRTLFSDYKEGVYYDRNFLFYGEWSIESAELLLKCDSELQDICGMIGGMDLSGVVSLKVHYESENAEQLMNKIRSISSLNKLGSPMKKTEEGWVPDFSSRYFTSDFPYGLMIIEEIAEMVGYDAVNIRETMDWYRNVTGDESRFDFKEYGIYGLDDLCDFYKTDLIKNE